MPERSLRSEGTWRRVRPDFRSLKKLVPQPNGGDGWRYKIPAHIKGTLCIVRWSLASQPVHENLPTEEPEEGSYASNSSSPKIEAMSERSPLI